MSFNLEYCEPAEPVERTPICEPVRLLIEHPFKDKPWLLARKMPDPGFYLLCTKDGLTMVLFEAHFERIHD
jgi:hypothetical protein